MSVLLSVILSASARVLARLPLDGFLCNLILILGTLWKICLETADLVKIGEEHRTPYKRTYAHFITASDKNLQCKNICATLSVFTFGTVSCSSTIHSERIVAFVLQNPLRDNVTLLRYTYITYVISKNASASSPRSCRWRHTYPRNVDIYLKNKYRHNP